MSSDNYKKNGTKFERCIKHVEKESPSYNPYAVCKTTVGNLSDNCKSGVKNYGSKKMNDEMKGGKGDNRPDSDFDQSQLLAGMKVELEHTDDKEIAKEIAKDHLTEDKDYYKKLKLVEKE